MINNYAKRESILLVLPEALSARVFFHSNIIGELTKNTSMRVIAMGAFKGFSDAIRREDFPNVEFVDLAETLNAADNSLGERACAVLDKWVDGKMGYFPLSIRLSQKNKLNLARHQPNHKNSYYDINKVGVLPRAEFFDKLMYKWFFSGFRYVPRAIREFMAAENVRAIVMTNTQFISGHWFTLAAKDLGIPAIGYVTSWDHPVGKGVVSPHYGVYIVQNNAMKNALTNLHGIDEKKIIITGWPQMDVYSQTSALPDFTETLRGWGLNPAKPCVLLAANTETNAPHEGKVFEKILEWRDKNGGDDFFSIIFRPHPYEAVNGKIGRFDGLKNAKGLYFQLNSFENLQLMAAMLNNVNCVVCTAGTVLLDSIVNNRPTVGIAYDEGSSSGVNLSIKNYMLEHYKVIIDSGAFYLAKDFSGVVSGIKSSLENMDELAPRRKQLAKVLIGEMDGKAAERVAKSILSHACA